MTLWLVSSLNSLNIKSRQMTQNTALNQTSLQGEMNNVRMKFIMILRLRIYASSAIMIHSSTLSIPKVILWEWCSKFPKNSQYECGWIETLIRFFLLWTCHAGPWQVYQPQSLGFPNALETVKSNLNRKIQVALLASEHRTRNPIFQSSLKTHIITSLVLLFWLFLSNTWT